MADQPEALPELTSDQESEVRRLLADARHDEPIPAEVGDRLDRVLAGLSRDEPGSPGVAPVIDLAARRRRRNAAAIMAGAAAVIVAGFAIGQVIDVGGSGDEGSASDSSVSADRAAASPGSAEAGDSGGQGLRSSPAVPSPVSPASGEILLHLSSKHLQRDLTLQLSELQVAADAVRAPDRDFAAAGCSPVPTPGSKFGLGDLFPALFDGEPAVVALRPPADGRRQADVLACGTAATLATASVPAR